jgi:hypothetical protein
MLSSLLKVNLKMKVTQSSETSIDFQWTTWSYTAYKTQHFLTTAGEDLKSYNTLKGNYQTTG